MIKIIQQPVIEPVTRDEAKLHSRIDLDADDSIVDVLIQAAREYCEMFQGRAYVEQTIEYILDRWPRHRMIFLPRPPVQSVAHVRYRDIDGTEHDFDDWIADTDSEPAIVHLEPGASWPSGSLWPSAPIRVRYVAGYEPKTEREHTGEAVGTGDGTEDTFSLDYTPIIADSESIYIDGTLVAPADYTLDNATGELVFAAAPAIDEVITADYTQDVYERAANIPESIRAAIRLLMGNYYENREGVLPAGHVGKELPMGVQALLWQDRVFWTGEFNK